MDKLVPMMDFSHQTRYIGLNWIWKCRHNDETDDQSACPPTCQCAVWHLRPPVSQYNSLL